MKTIAIELNHVLRNINRQLLLYYQKDFDESLDIYKIDAKKENALKKYIKFDKKKDLKEFLKVDYPYELFGCGSAMEDNLFCETNNFMAALKCLDFKDFNVIYFSRNEEGLTIQSTLFFLSKMGSRVRKVIFPENNEELFKECSIIVSSDNNLLKEAKEKDIVGVHILTNGSKKNSNADYEYDSLKDMIHDKNFMPSLHNHYNEDKETNSIKYSISKIKDKWKKIM